MNKAFQNNVVANLSWMKNNVVEIISVVSEVIKIKFQQANSHVVQRLTCDTTQQIY